MYDVERTRAATDSGAVPCPPLPTSEYERTRQAHSRHYAAVVALDGPRLKGSGRADQGRGQVMAIRHLGLELDNIVAALDSALDLGLEQAVLTFAANLWRGVDLLGESQVFASCYRCLYQASSGLGPEVRAHTLVGLAHAGPPDEAASADERTELAWALVKQLRLTELEAVLLRQRAQAHRRAGEFAQSMEAYGESLALCTTDGDERGMALACMGMAIAVLSQGQTGEALSLLSAAAEHARLSGDLRALSNISFQCAQAQRMEGQLAAAQQGFEQTRRASEELGDLFGLGHALAALARLALNAGDHAQARGLTASAAQAFNTIGSHVGLGTCAQLEAELLQTQGDSRAARDLARQAAAHFTLAGEAHRAAAVRERFGLEAPQPAASA